MQQYAEYLAPGMRYDMEETRRARDIYISVVIMDHCPPYGDLSGMLCRDSANPHLTPQGETADLGQFLIRYSRDTSVINKVTIP